MKLSIGIEQWNKAGKWKKWGDVLPPIASNEVESVIIGIVYNIISLNQSFIYYSFAPLNSR